MNKKQLAIFLLPSIFLALNLSYIEATSYTWNQTGASSYPWTTNANWLPTTGYPGSGGSTTDTAEFSPAGSASTINLNVNTSINSITFGAGSPSYTFAIGSTNACALSLNGTGITNNSLNNPVFLINGGTVLGTYGGVINFRTNSTAANSTITNNGGTVSGIYSGLILFSNNSTADHSTITNNGGTVSGSFGGVTLFEQNSTADHSTIINNGGTVSGSYGGVINFTTDSTADHSTITNNGGTVSGINGAQILFLMTSTAANSTITNNGGTVSGSGGGATVFNANSTAATSTLIANGGTSLNYTSGYIEFSGDSTGGTATVNLSGYGLLSVFRHNTGVTLGSINSTDSTTQVSLGGKSLNVTSNLSTTFGGSFSGSNLSSFNKQGTGTLTLTGTSSSFAGTTNIQAGILSVNGSLGNTVGGVIKVLSGGTLSGTGTIGPTTIQSGGKIAPGNSVGTLNIVGNYTQNTGSIYEVEVNGTTSDLIAITGATAVSLNGVVNLLPTGTYEYGYAYTILTSNVAVTSTLTATSIPSIKPVLSYSNDNKTVYLTLTQIPLLALDATT